MKSLVSLLCLSTVVGFAPRTLHTLVPRPGHVTTRLHFVTTPAAPTFRVSLSQDDDNNNNNNDQQTNGLRHQAQRGGQTLWESIKSLARRLDKVGASCKPKAKQASLLYTASTGRWKRLGHLLKALIFYTLYLGHQGMKGICVAMPPVYQQLYAKFSNLVEYPFEDSVITRDVNPKTGKLRWRTKLNVGLLATTLCTSYVVTGLIRVARAFCVELKKSQWSVLDAMTAAIDKHEENQGKMIRMGRRPIPKPQNYF